MEITEGKIEANEEPKDGKEEGKKPMCYGTYISENDILCAKCSIETKGTCIKLTRLKNF